MERNIFDLRMAEVIHLTYLLAVSNRIKNHFINRNKRTVSVWNIAYVLVNKFLLKTWTLIFMTVVNCMITNGD